MPRIVIGKIKDSGGYDSYAPSSDRDREQLAEMLATHRSPRVSTDSTFMADCRAGHNDGLVGESAMPFRRMYQRATGSRPDGKFYHSQLARFPGDPEAWVGSRGDIARLCKKRGVGYTGAVNVEAPEVAPPVDKPYEVAPDIVTKKLLQMEREQPGSVSTLTKKEKRDLREKTKRRLSGKQ